MNKSQLIFELQKFGLKVNPGNKKEDLLRRVKEAMSGTNAIQSNSSQIQLNNDPNIFQGTKTEYTAPSISDSQQIIDLLGKMVTKLEAVDKRLTKVETGDVNAFREDAKSEDVEKASELNKNVDKRIISIIEKTLGVDFGVETAGYDDKPGMMLTILVPQRLSPIATAYRPVMDKETQAYKIDPVTKRVVEEEYWPGDRRSVAMGANDSFDIVQKHANRVRSFIMSTYQKLNKPQPNFQIKS